MPSDRAGIVSRRHGAHRLYLRIYATVLLALALSAGGIALALHTFTSDERSGLTATELVAQAVADLLPPQATATDQQAVLARWSERSGTQLALFDAHGARLAGTSAGVPAPARDRGGWQRGGYALHLPDGRWLVAERAAGASGSRFLRYLGVLALIATAVGVAAYPLVRRLTRGLERLQVSVEALGAGQLSARVPVRGHDEVARLAASFNAAAARIEALVRAQRSLLANASHELRSPLARIRMALETAAADADDPHVGAATRQAARAEAVRSIGELDALVDEVLVASRLEADAEAGRAGERVAYPFGPVDLTALATDLCAASGAILQPGPTIQVQGSATLLRRLMRNLLENAQRHGVPAERGPGPMGTAARPPNAATAVAVDLSASGGQVRIEVADRGPGVPPEERERIFEPFYRARGASEQGGGVGLGLALVRQIARQHGGQAWCEPRDGGGSRFIATLAA